MLFHEADGQSPRDSERFLLNLSGLVYFEHIDLSRYGLRLPQSASEHNQTCLDSRFCIGSSQVAAEDFLGKIPRLNQILDLSKSFCLRRQKRHKRFCIAYARLSGWLSSEV